MAVIDHPEWEVERSSEAEHVLDAGQRALDHQFQIAERLDSKARGEMTIAGAWFAVVQGVAAIALRSTPDPLPKGWGISILGSMAVAGIALCWSLYTHYKVWKLRDQLGVTHQALQTMEGWTHENVDVRGSIVSTYTKILKSWEGANRERTDAFKSATRAWFFALGLAFVELLITVVAITVTS